MKYSEIARCLNCQQPFHGISPCPSTSKYEVHIVIDSGRYHEPGGEWEMAEAVRACLAKGRVRALEIKARLLPQEVA